MSASSLSKMRPTAMAAQLLGSSYTIPCRGLRIPLMFQLTTRNISTANCNTSQSAPNPGDTGWLDTTTHSRVGQIPPSACIGACVLLRATKLLAKVGRGFDPPSSHWREERNLMGRCRRLGGTNARESPSPRPLLLPPQSGPSVRACLCFQLLPDRASPLFKPRNLVRNRAATEAPPPVQLTLPPSAPLASWE